MTDHKTTLVFSLVAFTSAVNGQALSDLQKIDSLVHDLYKSLSFDDGQWKDAEKIEQFLFAGPG